jgi:hypothetical protein
VFDRNQRTLLLSNFFSFMSPDLYSEFIDLLGARVYWTIPMSRCSSIIWCSRQCTNRTGVKNCPICWDPAWLCENQGSLHWLHSTGWENCQGSHSGSNKEMEQDGVNLEAWRLLSYDSQATITDVHSSVKKQIIDVNPLVVLGSIVLALLLQLAVCCWCEDSVTDVVGNVECLVCPLFMFNQLTDCSESVYEC